jgi:hypothetical protein
MHTQQMRVKRSDWANSSWLLSLLPLPLRLLCGDLLLLFRVCTMPMV